jgi:hypothetical protein
MLDFIGRVITGLHARSSSLAIGWSLAVVTATTGFVSYTHISALTLTLGQSWKTAHLYPLFIDGQIVIGSVYYMTREGKRKWLGLLGIVPGVLASLFANWESSSVAGSWLHVYASHAWATVPAQAFAVSSFLFERWLKDRGALSGTMPAAPQVQPDVQEPVQENVQPVMQQLPVEHHEPPVLRRVPAARPDEDDERLPLPEDEDELRRLVLGTPGNQLSKSHQITRYRHSQLKTQFQNEGVRVA